MLPEAVVPRGRCADHGPPGSDVEDVEVVELGRRADRASSTDPESIARKFKRAVTDSDGEVRFDPETQARRQQPAGDPRRPHRTQARGRRRRLHAVRPAQGRRRRSGGRGAAARSRSAPTTSSPTAASWRRCCARAPTRPASSPRRPSTAPTTPSACSAALTRASPHFHRENRCRAARFLCGRRESGAGRGQMLSSAACRSAAAGPLPRISATVTWSLPACAAMLAPIAS